MRKFKILKTCRDKHTGRMLPAGSIIEVDEARAKELEKATAYASEIKEAAPEPDPGNNSGKIETTPKKAPAKKKTAGRKKKEA